MIRNCPNCGKSESKIALTLHPTEFVNETYPSDYENLLGLQGDERYSIVECVGCRFRYVRDVPDFLPALYELVIQAPPLESKWFAHQMELASQLLTVTSGRILDYGCGPGHLVSALNAAGIDCVGYDPHCSTYAARPSGLFDGVILSDVVEHATDPRAMLRDVYGLLKSSGHVIVNVPPFNDRIVLERTVNPWEHLNYFSARHLRFMVETEGFRVRELEFDVGLRPNLTGLRRYGNIVKSLFRLFSPPQSTRVLAEKC